MSSTSNPYLIFLLSLYLTNYNTMLTTLKGHSGFKQLCCEPMIGVGALNEDITAMLLARFAGLVAGACVV